jgi:hypothetical protein
LTMPDEPKSRQSTGKKAKKAKRAATRNQGSKGLNAHKSCKARTKNSSQKAALLATKKRAAKFAAGKWCYENNYGARAACTKHATEKTGGIWNLVTVPTLDRMVRALKTAGDDINLVLQLNPCIAYTTTSILLPWEMEVIMDECLAAEEDVKAMCTDRNQIRRKIWLV